MANKNDTRSRDENPQGGTDENADKSAIGIDWRASDKAADASRQDVSPGDNQEGSNPADNSEDAEQTEPDIGDVEVLDFATSSPLARHAISRFDSKETNPQLAEHWNFADNEIDEYGYF